MEDQDEENPNICTECIGDKRFKDWIRKSGKRGACETLITSCRRLSSQLRSIAFFVNTTSGERSIRTSGGGRKLRARYQRVLCA